ncbi:hypothetical protein PZB75_19205 [Streptomyces sp. AM 4-1-1]|uniref:hypothetical protein n=1 Tax=unclassified Streptomyces TaxID=2593676 RepID=UPI0023B9F900|nr:hypothetical protein [Streptomyces sp. AM 4-1-1]WEH35299.1 hypothetical protein PZB75_19205 [Streptomyces sp. AM 4-1-1]
MTFAEEWAQLKQGAAARMSLDSANGTDGQGGSADLKSSRPAWTAAGNGVGSLRGATGKALVKLEEGQAGLGESLSCSSAAAQRSVHDSWQRYVRSVDRRCADLQVVLMRTGNDQLETDASIEAEIGKLKSSYEETPALGGQARGR